MRANAITLPPHPAYTYPDGEPTKARAYLDALPIQGQSLRLGDTNKAIPRIIELSMLHNPPLRLLLGKDCLAMARTQIKHVANDLEAYESWSEDQLETEV